MHHPRGIRLAAALLVLAAWPTAGCGPAGAEDPADARRLLQSALDAWKAGRTIDQAAAESGVVLSEPRWESGFRLVGHEIRPDAHAAGFDLACTAELSLEAPKGKRTREVATYTISTHPARTVIRSPLDMPAAGASRRPR
ncbi:hypothetical protein [Planctomyces sp. SH-PL62]|uniref:hypothetical protein n=1 Tax=Planctomyces sp. SH-PL62 TaxID=1636152 RepID=UPI00078CF765|nr:hypothetical protein [Planctomyces sp. SH-PL62]AMV36274.1 hypothetical protein VT85_02440 [Planctomyces sp. SH-PL62]